MLPDLVGYVWLFIGLAGGALLHPGFARARAAALVGIPVSVITGTPFTDSQTGVEWGRPSPASWSTSSCCTSSAPPSATSTRSRVTATSAGGPTASGSRRRSRVGCSSSGLVLIGTVLAIFYVLGLLALVVVGIIAVVLLHRVNRAGWLDTLTPATPAEPSTS